jgi:acetate kinase
MTEDTYSLVMGSYDIHTQYTYNFEAKDYVNKARAAALPGNLKKNPALEKVIVKG